MSRTTWIAVVAALMGCGQKKDAGGNTGGSQVAQLRADAAAPAEDPAANAPAAGSGALAEHEPKVPPPPPTVKPNTKGDCKTEYAPRPTRDPNPMCKIDGGTFVMGTPAGDPDAPPVDHPAHGLERPAHEVSLSPYYLDQFEVTVAQVVHYLNASKDNKCAPPGDSVDGMCFSLLGKIELVDGMYRAVPGKERHPIGGAGYLAPVRYCEWAGKRVPTEAEWEFAARHDPKTGKDRRFPWGDQFEPRRANCDEEVCKDGFEREAPVGSFDGTNGLLDGSSPWGVHDLAGNAGEIVADCEYNYKACKGPCRDPVNAFAPNCHRMVRQSSWSSTDGSPHAERVGT
jgi:iron(II)-dependent oxidoreductase